jgi:membrane protein required for colicin V production
MRVADWNAFDWILVVITAFSMLVAYRRGLLRAILGLAGFVGGFLVAGLYYTTVGFWIVNGTHVVKSLPIAQVIAFLLLVVAVAAAAEIAGRLAQKALAKVGLGGFDRILGAAFGFCRGCLIGIALLMTATTFAPQSPFLTNSVLSPYLFDVVHHVSFLVPQYFQSVIADGVFDLKKNPPHWIDRP